MSKRYIPITHNRTDIPSRPTCTVRIGLEVKHESVDGVLRVSSIRWNHLFKVWIVTASAGKEAHVMGPDTDFTQLADE